MKKLLSLLLVLVLVMSMLAGCGGGSDKADDAAETGTEQKEEITLNTGYWVIEKMIMEGTEFSGADMEDLFGKAETIMALSFSEDGAVNGIMFEDNLSGTYTGALEKFEVVVAGEKMTGTYTEDKKLELKFEDGSVFILVNQSEMPESIKNNPWVTYKPNFSAEETCKMSNFMGYGRYLVEDGVLYGLTHKDSNNGNLGATPFEMVGDFPKFEETKVLDSNGSAVYLCSNEDYLYYIRDYEAVCRVKRDGSDLQVLYEGACDYLQIHDGRLYFTDADYHFVSTDMDGKDLKNVVDREIYYPYFICEDWMIFQDDADDESLHLYNTTHGTDVNITYFPNYSPVLDGKYLYYTALDGDAYYLSRIDMSDPSTFYCEMSDEYLRDPEFMMDGKLIYATNEMSVPKEDWKKLSDIEPVCDYVEAFVSEEFNVHHELDGDGLIIAKYLMSKETSGGTSFK